MKNTKKIPTISIGIPTYEAGESLVVTLHSLYNQSAYKQVQAIFVAVDGNTIDRETLAKIKNPKLKIIYFKKREGQAKRINDLFAKSRTDLLVLANDDIVIEKRAIENILKLKNNSVDLIMGNVEGLKPRSLIERIILVGSNINKHISEAWNNGDNYLSCNGRLIVLSRKLYNNIHIPLQNWNNDAFMYLFAKENNYIVTFENSIKAFFKAPEILIEHVRQSDKFQLSRKENQKYFKKDISSYYKIPKGLKIASFIKEFTQNPVYSAGYFFVYLYTRIHTKSYNLLHRRFWETDSSTKVIEKL